MKTARKHERFIKDLRHGIRVTSGFGFYLRPSYFSLGHMQSPVNGLASLLSEHLLEKHEKVAIARPESWTGILIAIFFEVCYSVQAVGASASHKILPLAHKTATTKKKTMKSVDVVTKVALLPKGEFHNLKISHMRRRYSCSLVDLTWSDLLLGSSSWKVVGLRI